jgi:hypothetical protein
MSEPMQNGRSAAYRRPPEATRFKPVQSGNPKGRPKGSRNFSTAIEKELNARVVVNENGKRRTITKRDAAAKQLVNKAVTGDPRALSALLNESRRQEGMPPTDVAANFGDLHTSDDTRVMANIVRRIREMTPVPHGPVDMIAVGGVEPPPTALRDQPGRDEVWWCYRQKKWCYRQKDMMRFCVRT